MRTLCCLLVAFLAIGTIACESEGPVAPPGETNVVLSSPPPMPGQSGLMRLELPWGYFVATVYFDQDIFVLHYEANEDPGCGGDAVLDAWDLQFVTAGDQVNWFGQSDVVPVAVYRFSDLFSYDFCEVLTERWLYVGTHRVNFHELLAGGPFAPGAIFDWVSNGEVVDPEGNSYRLGELQ